MKLFGETMAKSISKAARRSARGLRHAAARLLSDERGLGAVEFAMIAPLMFAMYFVTIEASQGIQINKKVGRIASTVADLITQQDKITGSEVNAIMQIGESIIQPYFRSKPTIIATAIEVTPEPNSKVKVVWSRKLANGAFSTPYTVGSAVSVPSALNVPNTFLVRVQVELSYQPMITWAASQQEALGFAAAFNDIKMTETYYLRPRMSLTIPCTGC